MPSQVTRPRAFADTAAARDRFEFGRSVLGPIFYEYCRRLWAAERELADRSAAGLYVARGGLRLGYLYERFLEKNALDAPVPHHAFPASRLTAAKIAMAHAPQLVASAIAKEFSIETGRQLARSLLPLALCDDRNALIETLPADLADGPITPGAVLALYRSETPCGEALRRHFAEQESLFDAWMQPLTGYARLLLIDTGWLGSMQAALMRARPQWDWIGLYFGRSSYGLPIPPHFASVRGLILDDAPGGPRGPELAILRHRHLIEMPLEPIGMESAQYYFRDTAGCVRSNIDPETLDERVASAEEPFFAGIQTYFAEAPVGWDSEPIRACCDRALKRLSRMILRPDRAAAELLNVRDRSADFGRDAKTPIFLQTAPGDSIPVRWLHVRCALWREGQAAISFPRHFRIVQACLAVERRCPRLWHWIRRVGLSALRVRWTWGALRFRLGKQRRILWRRLTLNFK